MQTRKIFLRLLRLYLVELCEFLSILRAIRCHSYLVWHSDLPVDLRTKHVRSPANIAKLGGWTPGPIGLKNTRGPGAAFAGMPCDKAGVAANVIARTAKPVFDMTTLPAKTFR